MAQWNSSTNTGSNEILNCCEKMRNMSAEMRGRGFLVNIDRSKSEFPWNQGPVITFHCVDEDDYDRLPNTSVAISLKSSMPINYCPFCGTSLRSDN